jgi:hypothetical protein
MPKPGDREEITDIISDAAYRPIKDGGIKKGQMLKMQKATLVVTHVDRKNKRTWAKHVEAINHQVVVSHVGHDVDTRADPPFCRDCQGPLTEPSTEDGDKKALDRRDDEERNQLSDGTRIE